MRCCFDLDTHTGISFFSGCSFSYSDIHYGVTLRGRLGENWMALHVMIPWAVQLGFHLPGIWVHYQKTEHSLLSFFIRREILI